MKNALRDSVKRSLLQDAEDALRRSEERYRRLFEAATDGILILDYETGLITDANPFILDLLGFTLDELRDRHLWDIGLFEDIAASKQAFEELKNKQYIRYEGLKLETRDGRQVHVEFISNVYPVGKVPVVQCNIRDISQRRRAEAVLQERTSRLQAQATALGVVASSAALSAGDVDHLAREITELAARATGVERASVWLFDSAEIELNCVDLYETTPNRHSAGMVMKEAQYSDEFHALKSAPYVNADDPLTDPRTRGYVERYLKPLRITSMLDAVISESSDRHLGLLCLEHVDRAHHWEQDEIEFACRLADKIGLAIGNHDTREVRDQLQASLEQGVRAIANTVESRDPYTAGHQRRVAGLAVAIAREFGLPERQIHGLDLAAAIHDIGKIQLPAEILTKPGKLFEVEYKLIQMHAQAGYDIVKDVIFPWPIAEMILQHHERLDGSGYPQGLKADKILLESKILAVADVVEAMASHRPYRAALGVGVALEEIVKGRGVIYDADVVDACVRLFREKAYQLPSV